MLLRVQTSGVTLPAARSSRRISRLSWLSSRRISRLSWLSSNRDGGRRRVVIVANLRVRQRRRAVANQRPNRRNHFRRRPQLAVRRLIGAVTSAARVRQCWRARRRRRRRPQRRRSRDLDVRDASCQGGQTEHRPGHHQFWAGVPARSKTRRHTGRGAARYIHSMWSDSDRL